MRSHALTLTAATAALLVLGAASGCSRGAGGGGRGGGFTPPPMPVETAAVTPRPVSDRFEAVGTIEAGDQVTIVAEIDGVVKALPFREGNRVAAGDLIARLDDDQLRAAFDRAEAVRDQEKSTFARVQTVVGQGAGSPQDLDDAEARLKVAEADLELAAARLTKTRITAPFPGLVGTRRVSPGAFLRAGDEVTDLARIQELRISFSAPERILGKLHRGAEVTVATTAFPGETLTGVIDVIEPTLDPRTRSARVIARAANPNESFRPGMSATVTAILAERAAALTVPNEAVFAEGGQNFVYVIQPDSTVARAPITLGTRLADVVEVVQGLDSGARVVRAGHQKLFPGARVFPVQSAPAEGQR